VSYKYIYIHYIDVFRWRAHLYSGSALQKYDPKIVNGLSVFTARDAAFGSTCFSARELFRVVAHDRNNVSSRSIIAAVFPSFRERSLLAAATAAAAENLSRTDIFIVDETRVPLMKLAIQSGRG